MDTETVNIANVSMLHAVRNGITGIGVYSGDKFEVLEGSEINMSRPVYQEKYNRQRAELLNNGGISREHGKYILRLNLTFNTPSGASDFVLGGSTNGWMEWKNAAGKTLDDIYRKA